MEPSSEFLHARLAAAAAIPPEHRSVDVSAFLEYGRLQQEVFEALRERGDYQLTCLDNLKLARAECHSRGVVLCLYAELQQFVAAQLYALLREQGPLWQRMGALLSEDTQLETWLKLMAGVALIQRRGEAAGMMGMANAAVALLQQPSVRRRLTRELAAAQRRLAQPLLTFEELLSYFLCLAFSQLEALLVTGGTEADHGPEVETARRAMVDLLPELAPDNPYLRFVAAEAAVLDTRVPGRSYSMLQHALCVAQEQGSDFYVAACGHLLAYKEAHCNLGGLQGSPPSAVLGWLQQAEAARARCKGVLPTHYTVVLDDLKAMAATMRPWLRQQQDEGDRFRPPPPDMLDSSLQALKELHARYCDAPMSALRCDGCGKVGQVRKCGACKKTQYCR